MMQFWFPSRLKIPNFVDKILLYGWSLYPFGLNGDVKKLDEHSRVLALFLQKIQICVDGFKLHIMVVEWKKTWLHRKNRVIHMILPMQ